MESASTLVGVHRIVGYSGSVHNFSHSATMEVRQRHSTTLEGRTSSVPGRPGAATHRARSAPLHRLLERSFNGRHDPHLDASHHLQDPDIPLPLHPVQNEED